VSEASEEVRELQGRFGRPGLTDRWCVSYLCKSLPENIRFNGDNRPWHTGKMLGGEEKGEEREEEKKGNITNYGGQALVLDG